MTTWPEERLREKVDAAGKPLETEVGKLLGAFGARRFTRSARRNVERALRDVGLEVDPPLTAAPPEGRVRISRLRRERRAAGGAAEAGTAPSGRAARPERERQVQRTEPARPPRPQRPSQPLSPEAKFALGLGAGLLVVLAMVGIIAALLGSGHRDQSAAPAAASAQHPQPAEHKPAAPPPAPAAGLTECVNHWNSPGNPTQRAVFATTVRQAGEGTTVADKALVTRYSGPPLSDVGVGIQDVNLGAGDCLVIHSTNVLFGFTDGMWHQIGVAPGSPVADLAKKAAAAPNATIDLSAGTVTLAAGGAQSPGG